MGDYPKTINGYNRSAIETSLFQRLDDCTGSSIRMRLSAFSQRLMIATEPVWMSIGENCAAGVKLKAASLQTLGSNFFDNLVTPEDAVVALLDSNFSEILRLKNLEIRRWENHDSVFDSLYGIFFHHYFFIRDPQLEKKDYSEGTMRRRIDEADVPLFLSLVQAQFEYLADKFRMILRSELPKILVQRSVSAKPISEDGAAKLCNALVRFGAKRFKVLNVHSSSEEAAPRDVNVLTRTVYIAEELCRWGTNEDWQRLRQFL